MLKDTGPQSITVHAICVSSPFAPLHYHKEWFGNDRCKWLSSLLSLTAFSSLSFSLSRRPQAVIKAVIYSYSLKENSYRGWRERRPEGEKMMLEREKSSDFPEKKESERAKLLLLGQYGSFWYHSMASYSVLYTIYIYIYIYIWVRCFLEGICHLWWDSCKWPSVNSLRVQEMSDSWIHNEPVKDIFLSYSLCISPLRLISWFL